MEREIRYFYIYAEANADADTDTSICTSTNTSTNSFPRSSHANLNTFACCFACTHAHACTRRGEEADSGIRGIGCDNDTFYFYTAHVIEDARGMMLTRVCER